MTRLVCLSDTHSRHRAVKVPDGDILLHAGDMSELGKVQEIAAFNAWLGSLPHKHKIVIAGNHDWLFQRQPSLARSLLTNCVYLQDEETEIDGLRVWGAPWQPWFHDWAFNLDRGNEIAAKWGLIPSGIDILITHGPPRGHGDMTQAGEPVGCDDLLGAVRRIRPRVHVFGHIHEGYGVTENDGTRFVNASTCNEDYRPVNPPLVIDITHAARCA